MPTSHRKMILCRYKRHDEGIVPYSSGTRQLSQTEAISASLSLILPPTVMTTRWARTAGARALTSSGVT